MRAPDNYTFRRMREFGAKPSIKTPEDYARAVERGLKAAKSLAQEFHCGPWLDSAQIQTLHWVTYKEVYPWAGQFRDIQMKNSKEFYSEPDLIAADLKTLNTRSREWFKSEDLERTAREMAAYNAAFTRIHPFLDGNFVLGKFALEHQVKEIFKREINLAPDEKVYRSALHQACEGKFSQLERQILEHSGFGRQAEAMRAEATMQKAIKELREKDDGISMSW